MSSTRCACARRSRGDHAHENSTPIAAAALGRMQQWGLTSEHERRLASDPTRHAHVARTVFRLRDVFDRLMKPTEQPRLVLSTRCTRYGALHPMWGATPDQKRCNAYGSGAAPLSTSIFADVQSHQSSADEHTTTPHKRYTRYGALHPMWGATPDVGRCTRCGALHPMWGATPDQKRCNAYRSGAAPNATSIFSEAHCPPDSASAHLPPSP